MLISQQKLERTQLVTCYSFFLFFLIGAGISLFYSDGFSSRLPPTCWRRGQCPLSEALGSHP